MTADNKDYNNREGESV
uniref:Uncharacterized protein n=1 Tax=Anguilla anguilla TaxID=7936 RepID=A0A0E9R8A8_ANGAN